MNDYLTSPEYEAAKDRLFCAECRLRCLTSALDRTEPEDFDALFERIKGARDEERRARSAVIGFHIHGNEVRND